MKINDTISVNPSKTALGHVENLSSSILRQSVLDNQKKNTSENILSLALPTVKTGLEDYRKYAVTFRTLFATILIISGLGMLTSSLPLYTAGMAICSLVFGAFLALGLFTRPLMLGAAAFYCISGALSIRAGVPDVSLFSLMFGCLIFAVLGAGKYSCDLALRSFFKHHNRRSGCYSKNNCEDYKAFHHVKF